ncbi:hypothetical protein [Pseudomonas syringae]|uniref:hypothetical protein n=1 Tax=Pseudomonas syringae TaxID=317 RepID=UPI00200A344A|nr:hypothetical protein [Pseudomonas syringae]MCK9709875.1 hypothetical protein [Pseudomonas syringae pv. syringae]
MNLDVSKQQRMFFGDEADAHAYWAHREWKTFAVDLIIWSGNKRTLLHTMYVRARDDAGAVDCAVKNDIRRKPKPRYFPRLAGPVELGCTPDVEPISAK